MNPPEPSVQDSNGNAGLWLQVTARVGYAARSVIYFIVGASAMLAAFGRSDVEGSKGALAKLMAAPMGRVLLLIVAAGLVCYSVWRFVQAVLDADRHGKDAKGLLIRFGLLCSCVMHLSLAFWAGRSSWRGWTNSDEGESQGLAAWLMSKPAGQWVVIGVGFGIIIASIAHAVKAYQQKYEKRFGWPEARSKQLGWVCDAGLYTRSLVLLIVGSFFVYAAAVTESEEAGGMSDALRWLQGQAYGVWLLAGMGMGLLMFACYSLIESIYRRVDPPR